MLVGRRACRRFPSSNLLLRGSDYDPFVSALDFECSGAAGRGALCGRIQCKQLCVGVDRGGGDWAVECDSGAVAEDHHAAAGDFDVLVVSFPLLWLAAWVGAKLHERWDEQMGEDVRSDFEVVQAATLTLLGLIIGFSFSMATGRYDLRKGYEESEANAIGTEYVRADLLPAEEGAQLRRLLRQWVDLRIRFYNTRDMEDLRQIDGETAQVGTQLWGAASKPAMVQPTPVTALAVAGMNDVLNSEGYTQAAWWNRIPVAAWVLMFGIAFFCNGLVGFGSRQLKPRLFMILPLVVAISFFLIADIDSPRGGVIRVHPQNLERLRAGLGE